MDKEFIKLAFQLGYKQGQAARSGLPSWASDALSYYKFMLPFVPMVPGAVTAGRFLWNLSRGNPRRPAPAWQAPNTSVPGMPAGTASGPSAVGNNTQFRPNETLVSYQRGAGSMIADPDRLISRRLSTRGSTGQMTPEMKRRAVMM